MPRRSWRSRLLGIQGGYYLVTGLWPLFHLPSFEAITGPKADDWLVRMVGLLAAAIGTSLIVAARRRMHHIEIMVLAVGSALAFTGVDTWYALSGQIAPVYLADAVVELGFIALLAGTSYLSTLGSGE